MQTHFTAAQLADADMASSEQILRKCVHCGFCTATCPTYVLLGDELDSPRGRIYLIKDMLENDRPATEDVVRHVDRCLSCLSCMTTCPSGVHYQHLVDHARVHIERTFQRPLPERALRALLAAVIPYPSRLRWAIRASRLARPLARLLPVRLRAALELAAPALPAQMPLNRTVHPAAGTRRVRVALLLGCAQSVLTPRVHAASIRVLNRLGAEVVTLEGCCGSVVHHLGRDAQAAALASRVLQSLLAEQRGDGLDAVVANASGCGTHLKDYGHLFRTDPAKAADAVAMAAKAKDITEIVAALGFPESKRPNGVSVAYHSACSMQHGQRLDRVPRELLKHAGYDVKEIPEGHLCCGSAGTYNLLQPALAGSLRERKLQNIRRTGATLVATGNVGCTLQLAARADDPRETSLEIVHTIELIDRAMEGCAC